MLLKNIVGFTDTQGISKEKKKDYAIGKLFWLRPLRQWENDHGRCIANGFSAEDKDAMPIDLSINELVVALNNAVFPCDVEATVEPHPEDPLKNVIVGVKVLPKKDITALPAKGM